MKELKKTGSLATVFLAPNFHKNHSQNVNINGIYTINNDF